MAVVVLVVVVAVVVVVVVVVIFVVVGAIFLARARQTKEDYMHTPSDRAAALC